MNSFEEAKFYFNEGVSHCLKADAQRSLPLSIAAWELYEKAADNLDKAIAIEPGHVIFWNVKAYTLRRAGKTQDALMFLDRAIDIDATFVENYYQAALCYFELCSIQYATEELETAMQLTDVADLLKSRFHDDLHEILFSSIFYFIESKKLGSSDELTQMGTDLVGLAEFAVSFFPESDVIPRLLNNLRQVC
jgi:tetratricopeptide (TPR) repeat protein